jgi:signal transduction histidine kinase
MTFRFNYSGLVVAGVGFFLTRFTVTLAIYDDPVRFYLAGVVPLALGLGLAAFGVALTVADVDPLLVRTTALWCVIGGGTMLVLVVLTLLGSTAGTTLDVATVRSQAYLSNFLIGGSVGGTLTGLYAARNRRQRRALQQQANRLVTLNRLLRHEVLNSVTAIRGYANVDPAENSEAMSVIDRRGGDIQETIEQVKYLTQRTGDSESLATIDLEAAISTAVETATERHPDADVTVETPAANLRVRANDRLPDVLTHLLENAILHGDDDTPTVVVEPTRTEISVTVADDGDGLPESQQRLLETGDIGEFDDPTTGFGLNVVRLLVESYGGTIRTAADSGGTSITLDLSRVTTDKAAPQPSRTGLSGVRPAVPHLAVSLVAAVLAGVGYGVVSEALGGSVAGIGVFYGTANAVVGWLTHEFHSIVFGFVYVGLLSVGIERYDDGLGTYVAVGTLWALALWAVAAGIVAPVWLRLLGIPAAIPNLTGSLLASHLVWGVSLALLTAWGYRTIVPWVASFDVAPGSDGRDN